jgi:hypothetical protein
MPALFDGAGIIIGGMTGVSDADLTAALLIAIAVVVVALVAWPGLARVRPRALAGYWASLTTGALYLVRPGRGRAFAVSTGGGPAAGAVRGVRGVRVAFPGGSRGGWVEPGGRQIDWQDGDTWVLQGVR